MSDNETEVPEDEEIEVLDSTDDEKAEVEADPEEEYGDQTLRRSAQSRQIIVVASDDRTSDDRLHTTEAAQLLAQRAEEIAKTGVHFAESAGGLHKPEDLAYAELYEGRCPLVVRRCMYSTAEYDVVEDWSARELALPAIPPPDGWTRGVKKVAPPP